MKNKFSIILLAFIVMISFLACPMKGKPNNNNDIENNESVEIFNDNEGILISFIVEGEGYNRYFSDDLKTNGIKIKAGSTITQLRSAIMPKITLTSEIHRLNLYQNSGANIQYLDTKELFSDITIKAKFELKEVETNDRQYVFIENLEAKSDDNDPVMIEDDNLASFIRECHNLDSAANITKRHMRMFKIMSIAKCQVHDTTEHKVLVNKLDGIDAAENLEELYIARNAITNISPLFSLKKLKVLVLRSNEHKDLNTVTYLESSAGIGVLTNLEFLSFGGIQKFKTTTGLEKLTKLKTLYLDKTDVENIDFVANLKNLELLAIDETRVGDITPLKDLTNLKVLRIEGKSSSVAHQRIVSLDPLQNLTNLEELKFGRHNIPDIKVLSKLTRLNKLELFRNESLTDLSPILNLKWIVNDDLIFYQDSVGLNFNNSVESIKKAKEFKVKWESSGADKEKLKEEYNTMPANIKIFLKGIVEK